MRIVVVIPTYNEAKNIGLMIDALREEFKKIPHHDFTVLVVDGNSPDGTDVVVKDKMEELTKANSPLKVDLLVEKKKAGLGAAYITGFKYAMERLKADVLIEMDADFQHDPKDVARLISRIDDGYDYVIGSRFMEGGSIPKEWALYRKLCSHGGNIFSKIVLGIRNVTDFTSGFKASRVEGFVDTIDLNAVSSTGFAYKIDLLFKMFKVGARIKEIPITFGVRDRGDSKMERNNLIVSLKVVVLLRIQDSKSFFKFLAVGLAGLFVDGGLFNLLRVVVASSSTSALASGFFGILTTFVLNNYWSFGDRPLEGATDKVKYFVFYLASSLIPILVRSKLIHLANLYFGDTLIISNGAFLVGLTFGTIWNYAVYSRIIWRKKS